MGTGTSLEIVGPIVDFVGRIFAVLTAFDDYWDDGHYWESILVLVFTIVLLVPFIGFFILAFRGVRNRRRK